VGFEQPSPIIVYTPLWCEGYESVDDDNYYDDDVIRKPVRLVYAQAIIIYYVVTVI